MKASHMRQSRQSTVTNTNDKTKYPKCQHKKEHHKESLNLVCLSPHCKMKGLICVQCKSSGEHTGHNIQPLKTFLNKVEDSLKKMQLDRAPKMQQNATKDPLNEGSLIQKLQEQHLQMLSLLKIQIAQISQKVRKCEQQVLKEFDRIKQKIYTQFEKQTIINKSLADIQKWFTDVERQDTIDLKLNVAKLLSLLKIQKNDFSVLNQAEKEINTYVLTAKAFKNNMLVWERQTSNIIGQVFKTKPEYQIKQTLARPTTAVDLGSRNTLLTFSPQLKTDSIVLDKEQKIAKVKDDKNGKIILLNQSVLEHKNNQIRFKIAGQMGPSVIQLGLCNKTIITQKQYKFQKNNANHGLFVSASNGFIYSSGDQQANNSKGHLSFKSGDQLILEVDTKENRLVVKKKSDGKSVEINLKHIPEAEWKELYFCVTLSSVGDKVQLLG